MSDRRQLIVECFRDLGSLSRLHPKWDDLACALGRPFAAPDWLLAWARHVAPDGAIFRVLACWEGDLLVAVAPLWAVRRWGIWRYSTFGAPGMAVRGACLIADDAPPSTARALGAAIAGLVPAPATLMLAQIDAGSPLPARLAERWRASMGSAYRRAAPTVAPTVHLDPDGFDAWMASKTSNFRGQVRRRRRRAEREGCTVTPAVGRGELAAALDAFDRLHGAHWGDRSALTTPGARAMLREAAASLAPSGRVRVATVALGDRIIGVDVFVAAGTWVGFWNGGWDPDHADLSPGFVALSAAVADAHARGDRVIDLGEGGQSYKLRFADDDSPVASVELRSRDWRRPLVAVTEDVPRLTRHAARVVGQSTRRMAARIPEEEPR